MLRIKQPTPRHNPQVSHEAIVRPRKSRNPSRNVNVIRSAGVERTKAGSSFQTGLATPTPLVACSRNQVCQPSSGNTLFGTMKTVLLDRSTNTKRSVDSRHSQKTDQGIATIDPDPRTVKPVSETSTLVGRGSRLPSFPL